MIRIPLAFGGVVAIVWGLWLVSDDGLERWQAQLTWFVAGVVAHDAVVAPVVVLLGVAATRLLRPRVRAAAVVGFIVWATVTVVATNVLLPVGGHPDNPSLMNRPYVLSWLAFTAAVLAIVGLASTFGRRKTSEAE
jgi:hypothetical protein